MKNIKIFATFFICLLVLSACSDDWKENALTAKFAFDKTIYYVGEEVSITNETMGGEGNYACQWDLGNGKTSTDMAPKVIYETNGHKIPIYSDFARQRWQRKLRNGS